MGGAAGGLSAAISEADDRVTVLDDKVDAEDHAAYLWMRAHILQGHPHMRVVVGTETLSNGWQPRTKKFLDAHFAEVYLHNFIRDHTSMYALRTIANLLGGPSVMPRSDAEIIEVVAHALSNGQAWVIELPKHGLKSRFITKTSPSAFAPINPRYGTKVDFAFIAGLEGDQWLRGYVPMRKGVVVGASGMTVASGFDLGQWHPSEWKDWVFPRRCLNRSRPLPRPTSHPTLGKTTSRD